MRHQRITKTCLSMGAALVLSSLQSPLWAQEDGTEVARPDLPIPRLADGTVNLGWVDPNVKGTWHSGNHQNVSLDVIDPEDGIPFKPWAKALYDYRNQTNFADDPNNSCLPGGGTRPTSLISGWEFIQIPEQQRIVRIFERVTRNWQEIHMDGRPHPQEAYDLPTWMGHAVGSWDGDTLVVDTVGFNEGHWMSRYGAPRTVQHHVTERFTRTDYYTLAYQATIDDPGAYTRPWTIAWDIRWELGEELEEVICHENNQFANSSGGVSLTQGQGHPLKGVWLGDWGSNPTDRTAIVILLDHEADYESETLSGSLNPGPDVVSFSSVELDHTDWTLHLEAQSEGVRYMIDGRIENLGSVVDRSIVGTWVQGDQTGDFKVTMR